VVAAVSLKGMAVKLVFEGIRCFATKQEAVLRPLTLLVGENSSGKSTFLAICRIVQSIARNYDYPVPFNEPPFMLGAYDQIASYKGGRRARSFTMGLEIDGGRDGPESVQATFVSEAGQPVLQHWQADVGSAQMRVDDLLSANLTLHVKGSGGGATADTAGSPPLLARSIYHLLNVAHERHKEALTEAEWGRLWAFSAPFRNALGDEEYAFAPIRTSPQRTYDPVGVAWNPTGSHIPMLLAGLADSSSEAEWKTLQAELTEFGVESGLFDQIEVIRKGRKESDPFQIGVKSGGPAFNLVDVGYGMSQVLPVLVDIARLASEDIMFLMQQPEVHLHPRAQAQLGTFFARRAGPKQRFVVETHSDYLIDRVRMEVRRGELISPEDVSILYFERYARGARIHNLELDTEGNIVNAPPGYRQFFLDETRSLLGI